MRSVAERKTRRLLKLMALPLALTAFGSTGLADIKCDRPSAPSRVRIVKIGDEKIDYWPGFAALRRKRGTLEQFFCGGMAIGSQWVVTAAHCVDNWNKDEKTGYFLDEDGYRLEMVLSPDDLDLVSEKNVYMPERIIVHEDYKQILKDNELLGVTNDIALIKLAKEWRGPIASIGTIPQIITGTSPLLRVAGFGLLTGGGSQELRMRKTDGSSYYTGSQKLRVATLPEVSLARCKAAYNNSEYIGPRQICAGSIWQGEDSCSGDSGGPLMSPEASTGCPHLVGVVSWGPIKCGMPEKYGIYTRLSEFVGWFRDKANLSVRVADTSGIPLSERQSQLLQQLESVLKPVAGSIDIAVPGNGKVKAGQLFRLTLDSAATGRLILVDIRPDGRIKQIVPNAFSSGHVAISSDAPLRLPSKTAHGFEAFEAEAAGGRGRILAIVVPDSFPYDAFVKGSKAIRDKTQGKSDTTSILEYSDDTGTQYLMSLTDQVLRAVSSTKSMRSQNQKTWAFGTIDYEYVN